MEEDEVEVKFLDRDEYYGMENGDPANELVVLYPEDFENSAKSLHKRLEKFHSQLVANHWCVRLIERYMRSLNHCRLECVLLHENRPVLVHNQDVFHDEPRFSLPILMKRYSDLVAAENLAHFLNFTLGMMSMDPNGDAMVDQEKEIVEMRLGQFNVYHQNYTQGIEKELGNCSLLRVFRNRQFGKRRKTQIVGKGEFIFTPPATILALSAILKDPISRLSAEKIVQITHANTCQLRGFHCQTDALSVINESLICLITLDDAEAQEELEGYDQLILSKAIDQKTKLTLAHWKTIASMDRNRLLLNKNLTNAQRLEEEAEAAGMECAILVETACRARARCGNQNDRIIEVITETIQRCPSLGPRMIKLARECGVGYETDQLLQILGDTGGLHPSEPVWLSIIEEQIRNIGKYGSVEQTLKKALKVLFAFLDFDSNRFNEEAWVLLKKSLEFTSPPFVAIEWKDRKSWWTRFQRSKPRDGRRMSRKAEKVKKQVLEALDQYIC